MPRQAASAVCCLLAACGVTPVVQPSPQASLAPFAAGEFPGAAALLAGFDERTDDTEWLAHDRTLFGLRLDRDGEVTRWLLLLEAPLGQRILATSGSAGDAPLSLAVGATVSWKVPFTSAGKQRELEVTSQLASVDVKVFTAVGELLTSTADQLPANLLGHGVLPAIDAVHGGVQDSAAMLAMLEGVLAVQRLLEIVQGNEALADYFWQVVDKPGLWSVLTHLGVSVRISLPLEESVPATAPTPIPSVEQTFAVPLRIDVNGSPALFVDLIATDSRRPFAMCGGIVAAIARHPTRPDTTLRMQLLAARCGGVAHAKIGPRVTDG